MSDEEKKENILDKLNTAFVDFVGGAFGESGKEFIEDTSEKLKEFSSQSIKQFMEFSDTVIDNLKLTENDENARQCRRFVETSWAPRRRRGRILT